MYIVGFVLSIILTIIPLVLVLNHVMNDVPLVVISLLAGVLQFLVQLFFFMHIREGEKPAYHTIALAFGVIMVITLIAGSAWIMSFGSQVS